MKRTALILGIALTLSGSTANVRAHGGCYGFWPFWPLAFAGVAIASAAAASAHSAPTYVYVPPAYPYGYAYPQSQHPSGTPPTQAPSSMAAPTQSAFEQASRWVPSSPGAGHWVPDPTPYNYDPGVQTKVIASSVHPASELVTINRSVGDVPVYTVAR
jgi:hypothetical protein